MNFTTIGTIGAYTKTLKMQLQWKQKKDTKNYLQKLDSNGNPVLDRLRKMREEKDQDLENIMMKIRTGEELTPSELSYLSEKNPAAYQKAKEIQQERESYERALKNCRTKDDVQRLKTMYLNKALSTVKSISNNPAIPEGQKLGLLMHENAKLKAVNEVERKFVESGQYDRLPTEAEIREENEEKREKITGEHKTDGEEPPEETKPEIPQETEEEIQEQIQEEIQKAEAAAEKAAARKARYRKAFEAAGETADGEPAGRENMAEEAAVRKAAGERARQAAAAEQLAARAAAAESGSAAAEGARASLTEGGGAKAPAQAESALPSDNREKREGLDRKIARYGQTSPEAPKEEEARRRIRKKA